MIVQKNTLKNAGAVAADNEITSVCLNTAYQVMPNKMMLAELAQMSNVFARMFPMLCMISKGTNNATMSNERKIEGFVAGQSGGVDSLM